MRPRKQRASKQWMMYLCPVVIALCVVLLPELENLRNPQIPGELNFSSPRPAGRESSHRVNPMVSPRGEGLRMSAIFCSPYSTVINPP
jgi:hypothetical protein